MKENVHLIFDIGKTTKKVFIASENLKVKEEQEISIPEIADEDGFPSEDLPSLEAWMKEIFLRYVKEEKFTVTHMNIATYGASMVHLNKNFESAFPFVNYLKPYPQKLINEFHQSHGYPEISSASPLLGMLNSGLQLFWLKYQHGDRYNAISQSLHFPQYCSFLFTQKCFSELTSLGCHTMMWDFVNHDYQPWVLKENMLLCLPPLKPTDELILTQHQGKEIKMGIGVHDSSAALYPYLKFMEDPFLFLSTGTWNIAFNPFNTTPLTEEELKKDALCYLTPEGNPIKASRIFLGNEYDLQIKLLSQYFQKDSGYFKGMKFDERLYNKLKHENSPLKTFHPISLKGTGPLPNYPDLSTRLDHFENAEEAYHQMLHDLVAWQKLSLELIDPKNQIDKLIVAGGFTRNKMFLSVLKRETGKKILLSNNPRATALGAHLLVYPEYHFDDLQREMDLKTVVD